MARAGVNYSDISKAATSVQANNQNPTVDRVLARLGSGSKSTIAPLLKRWKQEQGQTVDTGGLSDDILKSVKSLHDQLQQSADARIKLAHEENGVKISEINKSLDESHTQISQLENKNTDLNEQLKTAESTNTELRHLLEEKNIVVARLTAENKGIEGLLDQANSTVDAQKNEIQQVRQNMEHYQTRVAEDRVQEREQYQVNKRQLEERIRATSQQLEVQTKRSEQLDNEKQQLTEKNDGLGVKLNQTQKTLQMELQSSARNSQKFESVTDQLSSSQQSYQDLDTLYNTLVTSDNSLQIAKQLQEKEAKDLSARLTNTTDKLTLLEDNYRIALQEKAMLQGQLKQFQENL